MNLSQRHSAGNTCLSSHMRISSILNQSLFQIYQLSLKNTKMVGPLTAAETSSMHSGYLKPLSSQQLRSEWHSVPM
ncbi:hypothetical protein Y032_0089g2319 [Ancylostoma ceylanicum]|uniref:Uncharacterized protein n=1 Tax=Ancylostoma ceylanicum TaxID=53326 RepID=A0A016TNL7_9BILA|nr:hypothetical protein Y032_0089g2319 [Ancylostoma ceylanicum]